MQNENLPPSDDLPGHSPHPPHSPRSSEESSLARPRQSDGSLFDDEAFPEVHPEAPDPEEELDSPFDADPQSTQSHAEAREHRSNLPPVRGPVAEPRPRAVEQPRPVPTPGESGPRLHSPGRAEPAAPPGGGLMPPRWSLRPLALVPWAVALLAVVAAIWLAKKAKDAETSHATLLDRQDNLELEVVQAGQARDRAETDLATARTELGETRDQLLELRQQLASAEEQRPGAEAELAAARAEVATYEQQLIELVELIDQLETSGSLSTAEMVELEALLPGYASVDSVIAWDHVSRRGRIRWEGAPAVQQGFVYQLWALDAEGTAAGAALLGSDGRGPYLHSIEVAPEALAGPVERFTVTVEPFGGSSEPSEGYILESQELYRPEEQAKGDEPN